jgi:hypothetical protein
LWTKIGGELADTNPVNELQVLSMSSDTIYLSNGGFVKLPPDQVMDTDSDPTNEFQTPVWNVGSNEMKITDVNTVSIIGFLESEVDGDPTNELITGAVLDAEILKITDAGCTTSVDLGSLGGSGLWAENGTHIYNDNSGK